MAMVSKNGRRAPCGALRFAKRLEGLWPGEGPGCDGCYLRGRQGTRRARGVPWQLSPPLVETSMPIEPRLALIALDICAAVLPNFPVVPWQVLQYAS